jgi:hypothetical protein
VQDTIDKVALIRQRLSVAQDRQKSYADMHRRNLEFAEGDKVFLKVAPMKGVTRFGKKGKLNPPYIGPFEILERVGPMAYRLTLPPEFVNIHDVFHILMLRKYIPDPSHVIRYKLLQLQTVAVTFLGCLPFDPSPRVYRVRQACPEGLLWLILSSWGRATRLGTPPRWRLPGRQHTPCNRPSVYLPCYSCNPIDRCFSTTKLNIYYS